MSGPYLCDYYCPACQRAWCDPSIVAWSKPKPFTLVVTNTETGEKSEHVTTHVNALCPKCGGECRSHREGDPEAPL